MSATRLISSLLSVLLLTCSTEGWKTDLMGGCSQEDSNKMDLSFGEIFLWGRLEREMMKDLQTTDQWCRASTAGIERINEISQQCLTGLPKQVLNLAMYGVRKGLRNNCKDEQSKRLMGANLGCFNQVMPQMRIEMEKLTQQLRLTNNLPSKERISGICCSFYKFQGRIAEIGSGKCPKNTVKHMDDLISDFSGDALNLICRSVEKGSPLCKRFPLVSGSIDPSLQSVTFLPSCINVLANL